MFRLTLLIILFFAQPSWAEPTGDSWTEPCEKDLNMAIDDGVLYLEMFPEFTPDEKAMVLRKIGTVHALCIDRLITTAETMERKEWAANARIRFVSELTWVRNLLNGEMAEIYRQSKIYKAKSGEGSAKILAIRLQWWATEAKYPPALYDLAQERIEEGQGSSDAGRLQDLADDGYMPAMLDAIRRFLNGDGVRKNLGIAYYWIKRAEAFGGDVSAIIGKPHEELFKEMTRYDLESLRDLLIIYGDLDWTNIKVPDIKILPPESPL